MPVVVTDPDQTMLVQRWIIPLTVDAGGGEVDVTIAGELWWRPSVAWWPPMVGTVSLFAAVIGVAGMLGRRRSAGDTFARPAAVLLWIVMAANVIRTADDIAATDATLQQDLFLVGVTGFAVASVSALAVIAWRRRRLWFGAALTAGVLTLWLFGGEATDQLWKPLLVTELPDWVRRWTVAASFTVLAPIVVVGWLGGRDLARDLREGETTQLGDRQDRSAGTDGAPGPR